MLDLLQSSMTTDQASSVRLAQADFTQPARLGDLGLPDKFGLVIMPCNTLSTLSAQALAATLANVRAWLRPGGVFAASLPNPALLKSFPSHGEPEIEEVFPHPIDGEPVQVSSAWERSRDRFTVYWRYDHLLPDGSVQRLTARTAHYLRRAQDYKQAYRQAGLHPVIAYGDFDRSPYARKSDYLILQTGTAG
jgi:SAM-dependent methyltransferase